MKPIKISEETKKLLERPKYQAPKPDWEKKDVEPKS